MAQAAKGRTSPSPGWRTTPARPRARPSPWPRGAAAAWTSDSYGAAVVIQTAARAFLARRRRAAAARKIQAAARARQARLLEAFLDSLVFFPELGDIAFYGW